MLLSPSALCDEPDEPALDVEAPCNIATSFSCSKAEKAFRGRVLEDGAAEAELLLLLEATAASYSLWTLFKTFMAFTCRLSTYSGSEIGC